MTYPDAVLLAILQGLTEFLPVSSSGHLVLGHHWSGATREVDFLFDVLVHVGTLVAVVAFFRRDVASLLLGALGRREGPRTVFTGWERRALGCLLLSAVPTALLGLGLRAFFLPHLTAPRVVGLMLLATGAVLWAGRRAGAQAARRSLTVRDALLLGLIQGVAVMPGLSRSGVTIVGGLCLGLERGLAVRFSLLMSGPAILGATWLEWSQRVPGAASGMPLYLVGVLVAGVVGYGTIAWIVRLVQHDQLHRFAYYVWPLGLLALVRG